MSDYIIHDTTLTSIADAIRTKTGSNAQMTPSEMATAIGNISTGGGGGFTLDDICNGAVTGDVVFNGDTFLGSFYGQNITSFSAPNLTQMMIPYVLAHCKSLTSCYIPRVQYLDGQTFGYDASLVNVDITSLIQIPNQCFKSCTSLQSIIAPSAETLNTSVFSGCSSLTVAIFPKLAGNYALGGTAFSYCSNLSILVLGSTTLVPMHYTSTFNYSSLASGGSGCTIYVPSNLISSYKVATNWKTYDGYGTITWAAIEGSPYEQYKQTT